MFYWIDENPEESAGNKRFGGGNLYGVLPIDKSYRFSREACEANLDSRAVYVAM
jgi:hypothetical protein